MSNNVDHPLHYNQGGVECIDAIKAATVHKKGIEAFCVANVIKYLWRYEAKNGLEDIHKAKWYLERLIVELNTVHAKTSDHSCDDCKYFGRTDEDEPCCRCKGSALFGTDAYRESPDLWVPRHLNRQKSCRCTNRRK